MEKPQRPSRFLNPNDLTQPARRWISPKECSLYLGIHLKSTYRLIDQGEIPASRIGRSVKVDFKRLEELLEAREKEMR